MLVHKIVYWFAPLPVCEVNVNAKELNKSTAKKTVHILFKTDPSPILINGARLKVSTEKTLQLYINM